MREREHEPRSQAPDAHRRLHGRRLTLARGAVLLGIAGVVGLFALSLPVRYAELRTALPLSSDARPLINPPLSLSSPFAPLQLTAEDAAALDSLGLTPEAYALFVLACEVLVILLGLFVSAVLLWRRSDDWMAIFGALAFALFGVAFTPTVYALARSDPAWLTPLSMLAAGASGVLVAFICLFPDGRFTPGWTRFLLIPTIAWVILIPLNLTPVLNPFSVPLPILAVTLSLSAVLLCAALVHRYRRASSPVQRQQTKWFVVGTIFGFVGMLIYYLNALAIIFPAFRQPGQPTLLYYLLMALLMAALLVLPGITFCIALLRFRLWDVDVLIRRTLIYGALSLTLALLFVVGVTALQAVLGGLLPDDDSQAVTAFTTLGIAVLALPLRNRIQAVIDRRFYRQKYDAQKVVEAFAARLQSQTDMDVSRLTSEVTGVIYTTLQPSGVKIWLVDTK
jgi:hypothetical protein